MSNYPTGMNGNNSALPDVETGPTYCPNLDCNHWRDDYEGEPCAECQAWKASEQAYWLRVFTYDPPPTEDDLDAYTEPCERGKREGLKRWVGGGEG